jgi:Tfp pilus assembly protein PilO
MNEIPHKKPDRKLQRWVYVIGILFCADFIFYGYMPSHRRLQSLDQARAQQRRMIETASLQANELPALELRLQNAEKTVEHYEANVPEETSLGVFLEDIAHIMTKHHLTNQVVNPGKEVACDGVSCLPVQVNCTGSLKDIFAFFQDFQTMDRLVRVQRAVLQNDSDFAGQVGVQTQAMIFYRPQTQQSAGGTPSGVLPGGGNRGA